MPSAVISKPLANNERGHMSEAAYWDDVAVAWQRADRDHLWRTASDALHIRLLRDWGLLPAHGAVLKTDLFDEAAVGGLGRALAADAALFVGLDISLQTARAALAHLGSGAVLVADVRALPLAAASVDLIVSDSTLDHLSSATAIEAAIVGLARTLRPGGRLLATLDNPQHPVLWLRQRLSWRWLHRLGLVPYQVGATLSLRQLEAACRAAGLSVTRSGTLMHGPRVLAVWLGKLLRRASPQVQRAYARLMLRFECLGRLPGRLATGRFVAVLATKPDQPMPLDHPGERPC